MLELFLKVMKNKMMKLNLLKIIIILIFILILVPLISSCDQTLIDIYTQINPDYSGVRTVDIAVKTEYIQKGEVTLGKDQSLFDKILSILPPGDIETTESEGYTHFKSTINFKDVNFLQHISIDNFSEVPPERFYAKMEKRDYFFHSEYSYKDHIDMKIDEVLLSSSDKNSDYLRIDDLLKVDKDILSITYQVKFPANITKTNADIIGDNNIAIWNIKYGDKKDIYIEGKKTKFLPYFLLVILGFIGLFILFIIFALIFSSRRSKPHTRRKKPLYTYDNYFKKNKYFR